jgi:hypothetical protein
MSKKKPKEAASEPRFPYTPVTNSLRKFLKLIPTKPKPPRISASQLKSWGLTSSNDRYIIQVLKALGFVGSSGETTKIYESFMHPATGPTTLGVQIRRVYAPLFESSHQPYNDNNEDQKRLFNIHSGGSERTIRYQIQTFKALCEFASFEGITGQPTSVQGETGYQTSSAASQKWSQGAGQPTIHIDLHIHLPETKTTREYQAIIEDIARYIFKQEVEPDGQ